MEAHDSGRTWLLAAILCCAGHVFASFVVFDIVLGRWPLSSDHTRDPRFLWVALAVGLFSAMVVGGVFRFIRSKRWRRILVVLGALEHFLTGRSKYGGWWVRKGFLQLKGGDVEAAIQSLERGRLTFEGNDDHLVPGASKRLGELVAQVTERRADALPAAEEIVRDLDTRRAGGYIP